MFGSEALDAAIGLVFIFLLLSLICSSIKEAIETAMKYRARQLHRGITEMLRDKSDPKMVAEFYSHPLISGLFKGDYNPGSIGNLPSYIPARTFAFALLDLLRPASVESRIEPAVPTRPMIELRSALSLVQNESLKRALLPLIDAAGEDIELARKNIEDWYDGAMDRVSGWYKRQTQLIITAVGLGLAAFMNIDAIAITRYLNTSQTARSVMIARVQGSPGRSVPSASEVVDPIGWLERQGGLPVGWQFSKQPDQTDLDFAHDWRRAPQTPGGWVLKISGILFTTFAVSLGAPFWFDILNRFMVIRSTVKPKEKSLDEKSKA